MKTNANRFLLLFSVITMLWSFTSCCKDDEPEVISINKETKKNVTVVTHDAGVFVLKNLTSNKEITGNETIVEDGDQLEITFIPKNEYKDYSFQKVYTINEVQIDPKFEVKSGNSEELVMSATFEKKENDITYQYVANRIVTINKAKYGSSIHCSLGMSPDLLLFVMPEISYTDEMGEGEQSFQVDDDMWTLNENHDPELGTFTTMTLSKDMRFFKWGIDCSMTVRFKPKANVEISKEAYDFWTSFNANSAKSQGTNESGGSVFKTYSWTSINIKVAIGEDLENEDDLIPNENVQEYIDRLVANPQTIKFHIDQEGTITKITD